MLKEVSLSAHPRTYSVLELISLFRFMFPFPPRKGIHWPLSAGRNRDDPQNKWCRQLPECPKSPSRGQGHKQQDHHRIRHITMANGLLEQIPGASCLESTASVGQSLLANWSQLLPVLKPIRGQAGGKKGWLYFRGQQ